MALCRRVVVWKVREFRRFPLRRWCATTSSSTSAASSPSSEGISDKERHLVEQIRKQVSEQSRAVTRDARWLTMAISAHRGMLWGCGLLLAVGVFLFIFKEPLKQDTAKQTADVAKRVISERKVQKEALEATKEIVAQILRDEPSLHLLVGLLKNLFMMKDTQDNLASLLKTLFEDSHTLDSTKKFVADILIDEWIQDKVVALAHIGLHQLSNDEKVRDQLVEMTTDVLMTTLQDESIQHATGDAILSACKMSVGLSSPTARIKSHEEAKLEQENEKLVQALRDARLEAAKLQAILLDKES